MLAQAGKLPARTSAAAWCLGSTMKAGMLLGLLCYFSRSDSGPELTQGSAMQCVQRLRGRLGWHRSNHILPPHSVLRRGQLFADCLPSSVAAYALHELVLTNTCCWLLTTNWQPFLVWKSRQCVLLCMRVAGAATALACFCKQQARVLVLMTKIMVPRGAHLLSGSALSELLC